MAPWVEEINLLTLNIVKHSSSLRSSSSFTVLGTGNGVDHGNW